MAERHGEHFIKVRLNTLDSKNPIPFDLYIHINDKQILYLRKGDLLEAQKIAKFDSQAPDAFFVRANERALYKKYVHENLKSTKFDPKTKATMLRESSLTLVEELFESPDVGRALEESKVIINEFVDFMAEEPEAMAHLIGLSSHDFYTYTHSLDVGIYSLGLAQVAGFSKAELQVMGEGALFHDIGKRQVSVDIICKDGPLDENEWKEMQKHPEFGLQLMDHYNMSDAVKACCFEHHESMLGNGYPQKLQAHEIHPMAKIVALSDTFDALTTQRSYNKPMTPKNALEFMTTKLAGRYDPEFLKTMNEVLFRMEKSY